jgi:hypothetical protein
MPDSASDKRFQEWWNKYYFVTAHPLYRPYKQLYDLGADLDYVDQLVQRCLRLHGSDGNSKRSMKRSRRGMAPQENDHKPSLLPFLIEPDEDRTPRPVEQILREEAAWAGMQAGIRIDLLPEESDRKRICREIAEGVNKSSIRFRNEIKRGKADSIKNIKEMVEGLRADVNDECRMALFEFSLTANLTGGRSTDLWGKLFMTALTDHLRGTSNKPHYFLAYRTLKAVRGKAFNSPGSDRKSAKDMVLQFKRRFSYWPLLLKTLKGL